jgi:exopolysaccharide production protein ExoQ
MSKASLHSFELGRARPSTPMIDKCAIVPISVFVYVVIVSPLLNFIENLPRAGAVQQRIADMMDATPWNKYFWPLIAAISVVLALRNRSRLSRLTLPPHIICLLAYLVFAGASVLWAFKPQLSFIRFVQQAMIVTSIILPAMLAVRTTDMMRGLFLCVACASILNALLILGGFSTTMLGGYTGYYPHKNAFGEFAAIAVLLSLPEVFYPGLRRALGIIVVVIATSLLFLSNSKTSLALAVIAPFLAGLTLMIRKKMRISPAIVLLSMLFFFSVLSRVSGFDMARVSLILYGDATFTGRTLIWDFANYEIARRPLLGWGYQSFWLVGPDGPSVVDGPGWVRDMPNAHGGYYDTMIDMGYIGLAFLVIFLIAILHAVGRVADRAPARAQLVLSLVLFIILYNCLESAWMRGYELFWVVFLILAAEIGRYWQPFPLTMAAYGSRTAGPGSPAAPRGARRPRPPIGRVFRGEARQDSDLKPHTVPK